MITPAPVAPPSLFRYPRETMIGCDFYSPSDRPVQRGSHRVDERGVLRRVPSFVPERPLRVVRAERMILVVDERRAACAAHATLRRAMIRPIFLKACFLPVHPSGDRSTHIATP